jgi:hypothetical protein
MIVMSDDERYELNRDASTLAYAAINFTGLWKELTDSERDELANKWGAHLVQLLEARVDEEFTKLEEAQVR